MQVLRHVLKSQLRHRLAERVAEPRRDHRAVAPGASAGPFVADKYGHTVAGELAELRGDALRIERAEDFSAETPVILDSVDAVEPVAGRERAEHAIPCRLAPGHAARDANPDVICWQWLKPG